MGIFNKSFGRKKRIKELQKEILENLGVKNGKISTECPFCGAIVSVSTADFSLTSQNYCKCPNCGKTFKYELGIR